MKNFILSLVSFVSLNAEPTNYFDQFIFKTYGNCKDLTSIMSDDLFTEEYILLGADEESGLEPEAYLALQLYEDGTYWAEYGEYDLISNDSIFMKNGIEGTWDLINDTIELSDLGVGTPSQDPSGNPAIEFTFKKAINNPALIDKVTKLYKSSVGLGKKYAPAEEVCKK